MSKTSRFAFATLAFATVITVSSVFADNTPITLQAQITQPYKVVGTFTPPKSFTNSGDTVTTYEVSVLHPNDGSQYTFTIPASATGFVDLHSRQNQENDYTVTAKIQGSTGTYQEMSNPVAIWMGANGELTTQSALNSYMSESGSAQLNGSGMSTPPMYAPYPPQPQYDASGNVLPPPQYGSGFQNGSGGMMPPHRDQWYRHQQEMGTDTMSGSQYGSGMMPPPLAFNSWALNSGTGDTYQYHILQPKLRDYLRQKLEAVPDSDKVSFATHLFQKLDSLAAQFQASQPVNLPYIIALIGEIRHMVGHVLLGNQYNDATATQITNELFGGSGSTGSGN